MTYDQEQRMIKASQTKDADRFMAECAAVCWERHQEQVDAELKESQYSN